MLCCVCVVCVLCVLCVCCVCVLCVVCVVLCRAVSCCVVLCRAVSTNLQQSGNVVSDEEEDEDFDGEKSKCHIPSS